MPDEAKLHQQIFRCAEKEILVGSHHLRIRNLFQAPPARSAHRPYLHSLLGYGA